MTKTELKTLLAKEIQLNEKSEGLNIDTITTLFCDIARCEWHGVEDYTDFDNAKRYDFFSDEYYNSIRIGDWEDHERDDWEGLPTDLARVLNVIRNNVNVHRLFVTVDSKIEFEDPNYGIMSVDWNLKQPYEKQTPETKIYLAKLLCQ